MRGEEFERLYEAHAASLLNFLHYRTGDRPLAEDLLADTFERVLRARHRFNARRASEKTGVGMDQPRGSEKQVGTGTTDARLTRFF